METENAITADVARAIAEPIAEQLGEAYLSKWLPEADKRIRAAAQEGKRQCEIPYEIAYLGRIQDAMDARGFKVLANYASDVLLIRW